MKVSDNKGNTLTISNPTELWKLLNDLVHEVAKDGRTELKCEYWFQEGEGIHQKITEFKMKQPLRELADEED